MIVEKRSRPDYVSEGFNAWVRKTNPQERLHFPEMEVCREESAHQIEHGKMLYYFHKIAFILFPQNFIDVGAVTQDFPLKDQFKDRSFSTNCLYSKLVTNLSDHSIFSSHMQPAERDVFNFGSGKVSSCKCEACQRHRQFHNNFKYNLSLLLLTKRLAKAGIMVPNDDSSDHCQTKNKSLIFFEIEAINLSLLREYLKKEKSFPSPVRNMVLHLLSRVAEINRESQINHLDYEGWLHLPLNI